MLIKAITKLERCTFKEISKGLVLSKGYRGHCNAPKSKQGHTGWPGSRSSHLERTSCLGKGLCVYQTVRNGRGAAAAVAAGHLQLIPRARLSFETLRLPGPFSGICMLLIYSLAVVDKSKTCLFGRQNRHIWEIKETVCCSAGNAEK